MGVPPVTIYLQVPDSQPGLHLIAQAARMREARMTCASKDYSVRCKVRQPFSHSQRSICAGRTTILKTSKRSRHRTDGIGNEIGWQHPLQIHTGEKIT